MDSPPLQDAPAAVWILHGDAGVAVCLQVAGLDRNLYDLQHKCCCIISEANVSMKASTVSVDLCFQNSLRTFIFLPVEAFCYSFQV